MPRLIARVDVIQKLCIDKGIKPTANALAKESGITYEMVRRMFNGYTPSNETISAICLFFDREVPELFVIEANGAPVASSA